MMKEVKELMSLKDRVALITGGGGHIGYAMSEALSELGCDVIILDVNEENAKKKVQLLKEKYSTNPSYIITDLETTDSLTDIPSEIKERYGKLNILINSAAFVGETNLEGWVAPYLEQSVSTWKRAINVNLTAPFALIKACTPLIEDSENGSIINIGSTYGVNGPDMSIYEGTQMGNPAAYAASKGGLIQLTRWLSTVMAPKIRVNSISPGGVWRNQPESFHNNYIARTPLARMANEEDFKGAVVFLASDLSNYVTGQNLMVDGGWTVW